MKNLKLTTLKGKDQARTLIKVRDVTIGQGFTVIAGPCSIESEEQAVETAIRVKEAALIY
jgi:3-deoxy-7-phosphoheptulonate synthase